MKVLIISSEKEEFNILLRLFKASFKDHEVVCAIDKDEVINYASVDGPFDFLVVDAENKKASPEEICKMVIELSGDLPIIFLGSASIIDSRISQELFTSNQYNEKLLKPTTRDDFANDFVKAVENVSQFAKIEDFDARLEEINSENFVPMKLRGFYLYKSFPYNLYVEITPTRYLRVIEKNVPYSITQLSQYAKKNIRYLYIEKDDQLKHLELESKKCLLAMKKGDKDLQMSLLIALRTFGVIHQSMAVVGVTPLVSVLTEKVTFFIDNLFNNEHQIREALRNYPYQYSGISSKSLLTAILCLIICKKMKWDSNLTKRKLIFCSMIHDFAVPVEEMSKINTSADPRLLDFTEDDIKLFLKHPKKSAEIASQFSGVSDIEFIIENHHETPTRKGFPNKLGHTKLTGLSTVFNIAQFLAAELDGFEINKEIINYSVKVLHKDYNQGGFKDPLKIIIDYLRNNF